MKHKMLLLYAWLVRSLLFFFPDIPIIMRLRGCFYGIGMMKKGRNFQVAHSVILNGLEDISVGQNVYIANNCNFITNGCIIIDNDVIFGPSVIISAGDHQYHNGNFRGRPSLKQDVHVESGSWIASNVTITGGSRIPMQSIIGANSVVTKKMEYAPHSLFAGVPAKLVKILN